MREREREREREEKDRKERMDLLHNFDEIPSYPNFYHLQ